MAPFFAVPFLAGPFLAGPFLALPFFAVTGLRAGTWVAAAPQWWFEQIMQGWK